MFVDEVKIYIRSGAGGKGAISYRREKYVPRGGPDGGNGGRGGDVIIKADTQLNTLLDHKYQQHYFAKVGANGRKKLMTGADGPDIYVMVPVGVVVKDHDTGEVYGDLVTDGQELVVAPGGRGGKGNAFFKTPTNQTPRFAQPGEPGVELTLDLELKLLADVGIIGLPNAGKSTLISVISSARPKIADYPFTTLVPNLGVVKVGPYRSFVAADIPGLIEGASSGSGLGSQFLRHVERSRMLLHLVDVSDMASESPVESYETINNELMRHNPELMAREMVAVGTKIDTSTDPSRLDAFREHCRGKGTAFFAVSSATREGVNALVEFLARRLEASREDEDSSGLG